jgi:pyruvate/2-oxoglutarate dehydrogenase complex dihydrolipoamide dehydrogenase (E3) component
MTPADAGMVVARQDPFPTLDAAAVPLAAPARVIAPDVLVIGGGAAGLSAAITARASGASVTLLDERKVGGGQYFKQAADAPPLDAQQAAGADLLARAHASGAEILGQVDLWGAFDAETSGTGGLLFLAEHRGAALVARPKAVIVATGAYERPEIVPGWTLPGVMTTGAAQTLWRSYRTLPGRRIAVAGSGPLNLQVALELARGGAEIAFVAEAAPSPLTRPFAAAALALSGPRLTCAGVAMLAGLRTRGVPVLNRTRLARIAATDGALTVTLTNGRTETVDAACMNAGFEPQNAILRLFGCAMDYDAVAGHLRCVRDEGCATSIPGVHAAGDCAGQGVAPAARAEGRIAGRRAAALAGHGDRHPRHRPWCHPA